MAATTVDARGFDSEASWNTVSASARSWSSCQPHAEAIQVEHLVAKDHRDRETGDLAGGDEMLRQPLQVRQSARHGFAGRPRHRSTHRVLTGVVIEKSPPRACLSDLVARLTAASVWSVYRSHRTSQSDFELCGYDTARLSGDVEHASCLHGKCFRCIFCRRTASSSNGSTIRLSSCSTTQVGQATLESHTEPGCQGHAATREQDAGRSRSSLREADSRSSAAVPGVWPLLGMPRCRHPRSSKRHADCLFGTSTLARVRSVTRIRDLRVWCTSRRPHLLFLEDVSHTLVDDLPALTGMKTLGFATTLDKNQNASTKQLHAMVRRNIRPTTDAGR